MLHAVVPRTHRAFSRWLALLAASVVLLAGGAAFATPAPMCDEHAQSIAAPFPILPSFNGEARAVNPCLTHHSFELGAAPAPDRSPQKSMSDSFDRVPPVAKWLVPAARGRKLPPPEAVRLTLAPGFVHGVFRPPRSN